MEKDCKVVSRGERKLEMKNDETLVVKVIIPNVEREWIVHWGTYLMCRCLMKFSDLYREGICVSVKIV